MATANYSFNLPSVGGDDDVWGDLLNANWTALDSRLFSGTIGADTTGNAATATTLATARIFTLGDTSRSFDGSANVSWTLANIGAASRDLVIATGGGLTGGGNLTADRTLSISTVLTAGTGLTGGGQLNADRTINAVTLSQAQVQNSGNTTMGMVSGQRLAQHTNDAFNVSGGAPKFACRAWVNFNGTLSSGNIRASGNVSSVTRNGTGDYTVNFATAMPDANYSVSAGVQSGVSGTSQMIGVFNAGAFGAGSAVSPTTTAFRVSTFQPANGTKYDSPFVLAQVFR